MAVMTQWKRASALRASTTWTKVELACLALITIGAAVPLWLRPLGSSFWLDELGTYWVIKDGFATTIHRAISVQGQSPLYYLIERVALLLGGRNEIALRLPSVIFMALATWVTWRVALRLFDVETGFLAGAVFVSLGGISFAAIDARPYALALLVSTTATLFLLRWIDSEERKDALAYVIFAALTLYVHYLFALTIAVHVTYVLIQRRSQRELLRRFVSMLILVGILCLPLTPQFASLIRRSGSLSWLGTPVLISLLASLAQPVAILAAGLLLARLARRSGMAQGPELEKSKAGLLLTWAMLAPVCTFLVSRLTAAKIFYPRYFLSAVPALAILAGWTVRQVALPALRVLLLLSLVVVAINQSSPVHQPDDWRGALRTAAAFTPADAPVALYSGFVEAQSLQFTHDRDLQGFLLSPASFYAVHRSLIVLPRLGSDETSQYLESLKTILSAHSAFVIVDDNRQPFRAFFDELLSGRYVSDSPRYFGSVEVTIFRRAHE